MTNTRASGSDDAMRLNSPKKMSLEECLEFLNDDELLEVTPRTLRIRKRILDSELRAKAKAREKKAYFFVFRHRITRQDFGGILWKKRRKQLRLNSRKRLR